MPGNCTSVLYMEHPDGTTDYLSNTLTCREKGTKAGRGEHYSTTLLKNAGCDAPDVPTARMTGEFRDIVHEAWLDVAEQFFAADYCFAAGYFQPQPQAAPVRPEDDAAWGMAILFRPRAPQAPALLGEFLRAVRDALRREFGEDPTVVFPEEFWVALINPASEDRAASREARPPAAAAFKQLRFPLRVSPDDVAAGGSEAEGFLW